jgi:hypothetical protein
MSTQKQNVYSIPLKYRKMENMHIVFWLLKDISWCMIWKPLGIAMIFPTLIIAIVITFNNRKLVSETCHNLAIVFWITANSYWMISEFFHFDTKIIYSTYSFKHLSVIPFVLGMIVLIYYYLLWRPKNKNELETL